MTNTSNKNSCSASDIYYRMLQIGSNHTEKGISLKDLKKILLEECLVTSEDNIEHVEQWFEWAFEHKKFGCHCPTRDNSDCGCINDDPCSEYDHKNNCNRFLNKTSIIEFSQLEQSHKLNKQIELNKQQIELLQIQIDDTKRDATWSKRFAIAALIVSSMSLFPDWNDYIYESDYNNALFVSKSIEKSLTHSEKQFILTREILGNILDTVSDIKYHSYIGESKTSTKLPTK